MKIFSLLFVVIILLAGCGTGKHAALSATRFADIAGKRLADRSLLIAFIHAAGFATGIA